jgi:sugar phosphate isomerase/epimerase
MVKATTLPQALRIFHACGWECFELSISHLAQIANDADRVRRVAEARATLDELGASMPQAHAYLIANVAHPDESHRQADLRLLLRDIDVCAELGVKTVITHPGVGSGYTTRVEFRRIFDLNVEGFRLLTDRAAKLGLRICVENVMDTPLEGRRCFGAVPYELLDLIEAVGAPNLGLVFDTSHANVQKLNLSSALHELGGRIWCTHISDNDGSGDQHRFPGSGNIDWGNVTQALRDIGYEGTFNLEIPGESAPPGELLEARLLHAKRMAEGLIREGEGGFSARER